MILCKTVLKQYKKVFSYIKSYIISYIIYKKKLSYIYSVSLCNQFAHSHFLHSPNLPVMCLVCRSVCFALCDLRLDVTRVLSASFSAGRTLALSSSATALGGKTHLWNQSKKKREREMYLVFVSRRIKTGLLMSPLRHIGQK